MKKCIVLALMVLAGKVFAQKMDSTNNPKTNITLQTSNGNIKGTLQVPDSKRKIPLVIIVAGSGPTDRDGNSGKDVTANSYRILADSLLKYNIAVLRYDKRGIGESADASAKENDLRFDDYINDVVAWVKQLSGDKRFSSIAIAGHSEGSLIGMIACARSKAAKFISIAGAGKPLSQTLKTQLAAQPKQIQEMCFPIIDSLVSGQLVRSVPPMLYSVFRPSVQPYLISLFKYDPIAEIAKLKIPVLIINGTTDIQVGAQDAKDLNRACSQSKLLIVEGMSHLLKEGPEDRTQNIALYNNSPDTPVKSELVKSMVTFIKTN